MQYLAILSRVRALTPVSFLKVFEQKKRTHARQNKDVLCRVTGAGEGSSVGVVRPRRVVGGVSALEEVGMALGELGAELVQAPRLFVEVAQEDDDTIPHYHGVGG